MKPNKLLTALILLAGLACAGYAADEEADRQKLQADVDLAIKRFTEGDTGLKDTFQKAVGYAVFPNVGKGGFVLGGAHGNGQVYEGASKNANSGSESRFRRWEFAGSRSVLAPSPLSLRPHLLLSPKLSK